MNKIESLNIEFNSLDYLTFTKFLSFMSKNQNIKSLKISFFSSLITYSPQFIYKLYHQNDENNEINNFNYNNDTPISFILNELLPYFIDNIQAIFELIRSKKHLLQILNLIFDIPEIIAVKQSYLNGILKLILNILLLIDNKNSVITQLAILSPKTIIDSRSMPNVEDIIDCINVEKNNKTIKELTMQMQLYQINNIKNFISSNLIKLKIGEVDIITLKQLTKFLCSFAFLKKSSLKLLSIGILNHIIHFSKEVEYLLNEIFSIKIKTLKEINVCCNIIIDDKNSYYKILENNWISSCVLTLNEKSKFLWQNENNQNKKILYLLHHELEDEILIRNEIVTRDKKKYTKTNCEVVWYLKYILIERFAKKRKIKISYYEMKNIIFNIMKFLYFTKTAKIKNEVE
jgi:hypothetical protein